MQVNEFSHLSYKEQLQVLNQRGKLQLSFNVGEYQITLYKVEDFFVELKRHVKELHFDTIHPFSYKDLSRTYQLLL